jgi:hypothetical protein
MDRGSFPNPPSVAPSDAWLPRSASKAREKAGAVRATQARPWPDGPWHVAHTPALASSATAADLNVRCSDFLPRGEWRRQGEGHYVDVGLVVDRGGAVKLRTMGEEVKNHGCTILHHVGPPPPARNQTAHCLACGFDGACIATIHTFCDLAFVTFFANVDILVDELGLQL